MDSAEPRAVDPRFFDLVNYGVCRAISEVLGRSAATAIFRQAGELVYAELKRQGVFTEEAQQPLDRLIQIVEYLKRSGYMGEIQIERLSDREMIVDMYQITVLNSSMRLVEEGFAPSHYMTNLMFAALKEQGLQAELVELEFDPEANHVREKWSIKEERSRSGE